MSFLSLPYAALLALTLLSQLLLPTHRQRNVALLLASVVFYAWIHPWFLGPLLISALVDHSLALAITANSRRARWAVPLSVAVNLGQLAVFKYHGFFVDIFGERLGVDDAGLRALGLVIPAGISFYTFQTLGYTIEVARGEARARRDLLDYLLYVGFFPQLVAGPIERPEVLLPQLERPRQLTAATVASGLSLIAWGVVQKVLVADSISVEVDAAFTAAAPGRLLLLAGAMGFGLQLFADFSGYTDIARGSARVLGVQLSPNFDKPFLAVTTPGFWRRWHLSLSRWVGAMVYGPLVRRGQPGPARITLALLVSFLVVGLWHGADATFVALGLLQGAAAVLYTFLWPRLPWLLRTNPFFLVIAWGVHTFGVLVPSAVLFREVSLGRVVEHAMRLTTPTPPDDMPQAAVVFAAIGVLSLPLLVGSVVNDRLAPAVHRTLWWAVAAALALAASAPLGRSFVYFQF